MFSLKINTYTTQDLCEYGVWSFDSLRASDYVMRIHAPSIGPGQKW